VAEDDVGQTGAGLLAAVAREHDRIGAVHPCRATQHMPTIITPTRIAWQEFTDT